MNKQTSDQNEEYIIKHDNVIQEDKKQDEI